METSQRILLVLLKDLTIRHTVSSLAKETGLSRVGVWKILKNLEAEKIVVLSPIGIGKTSVYSIGLSWNNILTEKSIELLLAKEAQDNQRWLDNFKDLEKAADFLVLFGSIMHSPKEAVDIDILIMADRHKFNDVHAILSRIQKIHAKKIHSTNLTAMELREELKKPNKAIVDALKKGIILFGHKRFIKFVKGMNR